MKNQRGDVLGTWVDPAHGQPEDVGERADRPEAEGSSFPGPHSRAAFGARIRYPDGYFGSGF